MNKNYPDNINSLITQEVRDPEQIFYVWVFKCDDNFHKKYYVSPKSGKFYKLDRTRQEEMSFIADLSEKDAKALKDLQEKFNSDFYSFKNLITAVAETSKDRLRDLYGSEDLNEVLNKQKEKIFEDIVNQNSKVMSFKNHFFENKQITREELTQVNDKQGN